MIIIDARPAIVQGIRFSQLKVGQIYADKDGHICIKTRDIADTPSERYNCIFCVDNDWSPGFEDADNEVEPLQTELILKGRDNQYD